VLSIFKVSHLVISSGAMKLDRRHTTIHVGSSTQATRTSGWSTGQAALHSDEHISCNLQVRKVLLCVVVHAGGKPPVRMSAGSRWTCSACFAEVQQATDPQMIGHSHPPRSALVSPTYATLLCFLCRCLMQRTAA
jgi:hypothetical protein